MDVITRTTFHLQARNRSGTDDQAETGPDRVGTNSGSGPTSVTCAPDSMSFNEFHFLHEFHITRCRTKVSGIVAHLWFQRHNTTAHIWGACGHLTSSPSPRQDFSDGGQDLGA